MNKIAHKYSRFVCVSAFSALSTTEAFDLNYSPMIRKGHHPPPHQRLMNSWERSEHLLVEALEWKLQNANPTEVAVCVDLDEWSEHRVLTLWSFPVNGWVHKQIFCITALTSNAMSFLVKLL